MLEKSYKSVYITAECFFDKVRISLSTASNIVSHYYVMVAALVLCWISVVDIFLSRTTAINCCLLDCVVSKAKCDFFYQGSAGWYSSNTFTEGARKLNEDTPFN